MSISTNADSHAERLVVCRACDWVVTLPVRAPGQAARCPRCRHHLTEAAQRDAQRPLAWGIATLVTLGLVFCFSFLSFSAYGVGHVMAFGDTLHALIADDYAELAVILLAFTALFPGLYLAALIYLCSAVQLGRTLPGQVVIARALRPIEPWMMSDVFIVGVLVALIKIISLASIHIHTGFVAFCLFSVLMLRTVTLIDWTSLWDVLAPRGSLPTKIRPGATGRAQGLVACHGCDTPFMADRGPCCPRCGKRHVLHRVNRIQLTWALLITATLAYIPANVYPVLSTIQLGNAEPQTIAGGVMHLLHAGDWPIALVIFVASIVVPISKIVALAWLCLAARRPRARASLSRTRLFHITEKIGRWSMIDVFVVATLTTLVQAGSLMSIAPGPGAVAFALVVILTMIAAHTFDTRLLWSAHTHTFGVSTDPSPSEISHSA
ncbi:PqiA/YebS family transporter subunit [Salinisphaera japonica]|uniref:Paraquat-inducible protein A n=1 Tax=Salinisphaera japonica YTM-1 TaxID=1209778 RepID=A0A423PQQ0_9GAMM|nr:PqiA/YebS family transporter subunit [Salinisphaera japonica]ROO27913.1 paraquat-inducible protein A [Salinisphaera japonica YTM-1]